MMNIKMSKIQKVFYSTLFILTAFISFTLNAEKLSLSSFSDAVTINSESKNVYMPITITAPDNGYFYSNPKGPGTGKPVLFNLLVNNKPVSTTIHIEKPEKYLSKLETSSEKWVWRHHGTTKLYVDLAELIQKTDSSVKLTLDALFCDDNNCTPVTAELSFSLIPGNTNSNELLAQLPENLNQIQTISTENITSETENKVSLGYNFTPRFLKKSSVQGLIPALILGLLAGIILNIMPCVLPVISLKLMALINHSENKGELFISSLFYSAGVLITFLVLASLSVFAGQGWGALFQQQEFIIVMTIIIFGLSLSMLGLYTLSPPQIISKVLSKQGGNSHLGSFLSGLLATLLATPCSGPFLGATLAWTLTQKPLIVYAVFLSIGTGLALPYVILSLFPSLLKKIPRGGNWTIYTEKVFGFILTATAIYFLTLLTPSYVLFTITLLWFTAVGLWQFGIFSAPVQSKRTRQISSLVLIILLISGFTVSKNLFLPSAGIENTDHKEFSYDTLQTAIDNNNVVFVKFTADWCPNCKLVEATAVKDESVQNYMKENSIVILTADISTPGTIAEQLLHQLDSKSIPFAAVFTPGTSFQNPICLRDIYSKEELLAALKTAVNEKEQNPEKPEQKVENITF